MEDLSKFIKNIPFIKVKLNDSKSLLFAAESKAAAWRALTLYDKEPSTIDWLNTMKQNDTLLDIGANVGNILCIHQKEMEVR